MAVQWTRDELVRAGFVGFVPFDDLPTADVPNAPGVYMVLHPVTEQPEFVAISPAGWHKRRDPTVERSKLVAAWVPGSEVIYIGKATMGKNQDRGLRVRLDEFRRHGLGGLIGHWGGRYIWQLAKRGDLLVCWKATPGEDPGDIETALIASFKKQFDKRPFANRNSGRRIRAR